MKLSKNTVAVTFAAVLIGGLSINPASAANRDSGRTHTGAHEGFEISGKAEYENPRSAPKGTKPIINSGKLKSKSRGRTNGRSG